MREARPAAVAGTWYPASQARLAEAVDAHLASTEYEDVSRCPSAIVAPHAGLMYSGPVAAHAYAQVARCAYDAVVLVGPSHAVGFHGVAIWPEGAWDTPFGPVAIAGGLAQAVMAGIPEVHVDLRAHAREHSLEMQLPFVARLLPGVPIVPLLMGFQARETILALGDGLARVVSSCGGPVLLVASSDLSHYEDAATAFQLDTVVLAHIEALDAGGLMDSLDREPRHACGGGPIAAILRASTLLGCANARIVSYADSGDVSGDKSSVVGYAAAIIW